MNRCLSFSFLSFVIFIWFFLLPKVGAQSTSYSPDDAIWGIYATGNGYPVFSPALFERAEYEAISPECLKSLTIAVMPSALVSPDTPATYWLALNMTAGLIETKVEGISWWDAQQQLAVFSPYRNPEIDCIGNHGAEPPSLMGRWDCPARGILTLRAIAKDKFEGSALGEAGQHWADREGNTVTGTKDAEGYTLRFDSGDGTYSDIFVSNQDFTESFNSTWTWFAEDGSVKDQGTMSCTR